MTNSTAGSSGRPKGVLSTHQGAVSYLRYILDTYDLGATDRVLQLASLGFDASVRDLLGPLAAGATVILAEPGQAKVRELLRQGLPVLDGPVGRFADGRVRSGE